MVHNNTGSTGLFSCWCCWGRSPEDVPGSFCRRQGHSRHLAHPKGCEL